MDGPVWTLAIDTDGALYAGGDFGSAGGVDVNLIAEWTSRTSMSVLGTNGTAIINNEAANANKGTDFGSSSLGFPLTNTFSITNSGTETLRITGITTNGAACFIVSRVPEIVDAGSVSNFTVRFNPYAVGLQTAVVAIANSSSRTPYRLNFRGEKSPLHLAAGDIDGDRLADLITVADSKWYAWFSSAQYLVRGGPYDLGIAGLPTAGDIDGDGLSDLLVDCTCGWYAWFSTTQYLVRNGPYNLGITGIPTTGDIDGDGLADVLCVVGSKWYAWFSSAQYLVRGGPYDLGIAGLPAAGDIDGDGLADLLMVVGSNWYAWFSTSRYLVRGGPYTLSLP
jgi:hypothetical protein